MYKNILYQKNIVFLFAVMTLCPSMLLGILQDATGNDDAYASRHDVLRMRPGFYGSDTDDYFRIQPQELFSDSDNEGSQDEVSEGPEASTPVAEVSTDLLALTQKYDSHKIEYLQRIQQFLDNIQSKLMVQPMSGVYMISAPGRQLLDVVTNGNYYARLAEGHIPANSSLFGQQNYAYPYCSIPAAVQAYNIPMSSLMMQGKLPSIASHDGGLVGFVDNIIAAAGLPQSTLTHLFNSVFPVNRSLQREVGVSHQNWQAFAEWVERLSAIQVPSFSYLFSYNASGYASSHYYYPINAQLWFYNNGSYYKVPATIKELIGLMVDVNEVKAICKEGQELHEFETQIKECQELYELETQILVNKARNVLTTRVNEVAHKAALSRASTMLQAVSRGVLARTQANLVQDAGARQKDAAAGIQAAVRGELARNG